MSGFFSTNWGDVVGAIGILFALWGIWKSKSAAERAEEAATETRDTLIKSDVIGSCSTAIGYMEELKRLQRKGEWPACLERYSSLVRVLGSVKSGDAQISTDDMARIQGAITQISDIEARVDRALADSKPVKAAPLNEILSKQIETVHEIQMKLKKSVRKISV